MSAAQHLGADPYYHRALPLDELSAHALQAAALEHAVPGLRETAIAVAAKNRAHGNAAYPDRPTTPDPGPARWPILPEMTSRPVTGAVALILAGPDFVAERAIADPAWLRGMGWATEASFLGDRDLSQAPALTEAARQAFAAANITASAIDVAELTDATPYGELLAYEGLGLARREAWAGCLADGTFARGGRTPVNLSGGVLTYNPVFCTGLIRIAEIARQVRGHAGLHQLPGARLGLAHAGSGFAMQYQAAIILGREARP